MTLLPRVLLLILLLHELLGHSEEALINILASLGRCLHTNYPCFFLEFLDVGVGDLLLVLIVVTLVEEQDLLDVLPGVLVHF